MSDSVCKNCRWFIKGHSDYTDGQCHRYPPALVDASEVAGNIELSKTESGGLSGGIRLENRNAGYSYSGDRSSRACWPAVNPNDFCGEWKTNKPNGIDRATETAGKNGK